MSTKRSSLGLGISVLAHAGLLVVAVPELRRLLPEPEPETVEVELVTLRGSPQPRGLTGEGGSNVAQPRVEAPEPTAAPEPPRSPPRMRAATRAPRPRAPPPIPEAPLESAAPPTPEVAPPQTPAATEADEPSDGPGDVAVASGNTGASGEAGQHGSGDRDDAWYGREIARIVLAEVDRDPVAGIARGHAVRVELVILPDGGLARRGTGRYDFVEVLASTLGPLRTRKVLQRIERASRRFPPHPDGLPCMRCPVDITIAFVKDRS